jgi:hypothetical protein
MVEMQDEFSLMALAGYKSKHDDFGDTVSMLGSLQPWKPAEDAEIIQSGDDSLWGVEGNNDDVYALSSYIV